MENELNFQDTIKLLDIYVNYVKNIKNFYDGKIVKFRLPNFPEDISENIVKHIIKKVEGISCKRIKIKGDLICDNNAKIEVKCFTSNGPSSIGPNECWNIIYFLDAKDYLNGNYKLYKIPLSNTSREFQNIPINKKQSYKNQCDEKRRPRISFQEIKKYLDKHIEVIFDGNINTIISNPINEINEIDSKLSQLYLNKN
jgi:hypothetical protein